MDKKILIVEDDGDIAELLKEYLQEEGYQVIVAADGVQGIQKFHDGTYDLVLLDIMLPKIDGYGVCEIIRGVNRHVPIMMLTALDDEKDQIRGYDLLIDEYITKPFSMKVLMKKIAAVMRRSNASEKTDMLVHKDIAISQQTHIVLVGGKEIELTAREFELLWELLMHQGMVLTRQFFIERLWGYDFEGDDRVVDTHIKNLRQKLNVNYIETIRGVGYRIGKSN